MGSSAEHTRLIKDTLLTVGRVARVWRNETGVGLNQRTGQPFSYGLPGSPDIIGFTRGGKFLGIEIKTGLSRLSEKQLNFQETAKRFGALYFVVKSVTDAQDLATKLSSGNGD